MSRTPDVNWPPAASLLGEFPKAPVALLGLHTYTTSVTPRSAQSTPDAIRGALARYSTWSYEDQRDIEEGGGIWDLGNIDEADGVSSEELRAVLARANDCELRIILGGDNAVTWHALSARADGDYSNVGLITLDAHLDMREGRSNGSPVRQLLEQGLNPHHVVQIGLADFSNSSHYANVAREAGSTVITRAELRSLSIVDAAKRALDIAGAGGRKIHCDIDVDVIDRAFVPGCPAAAPGGLTPDEVRQFARVIAADSRVDTLDITEIDIDRDINENTVRLAALVVLEAYAGVLRRIA
jgi:formiminoglutamase